MAERVADAMIDIPHRTVIRMNRFFKFLAALVLIALGGYVAFSSIFPTHDVRYRLSLVLDVDGVEQTSSGVIGVSYQLSPDGLVAGFGGSHFGGDMHGNAVTIDLGKRGLIFVIDSGSLVPKALPGTGRLRPASVDLSRLPLDAYSLPTDGAPSAMAQPLRQLRAETKAVDVPIEKLPMFVRFRDIDDPVSIEEIDPGHLDALMAPA